MSDRTYGSSLLSVLGWKNVLSGVERPVPGGDARAAGRVRARARAAARTSRTRSRTVTSPRSRPRCPTARVALVDGQDLFWWGIRTPDALERLSAARLVAAVPSWPCSAPSSTPTTSSSATPCGPSSPRSSCPHSEEWEHAGIVDREVFAKAGAQGFLGMAVPEEYGGGGVADFRYNVVIAEEIQRGGRERRGSRAGRCTTTSACRTSSPCAPRSRRRGGSRGSARASSSPRSR